MICDACLMSLDNLQLFALVNAPAAPAALMLLLARAIAQGLIWLVPPGLALAWLRTDREGRRELLQILFAVLVALGVGQIVTQVWPQPRPFALHLGHQFLAHADDPGLPSDHVTVFWSLAAGASVSRRFRSAALLLFALGLLVGWSRVYLGVHFPFDVLGAAPVATAGLVVERLLRARLCPLLEAVLRVDDRVRPWLRTPWRGRA
jgi:undecaprenyl-diphosphatase